MRAEMCSVLTVLALIASTKVTEGQTLKTSDACLNAGIICLSKCDRGQLGEACENGCKTSYARCKAAAPPAGTQLRFPAQAVAPAASGAGATLNSQPTNQAGPHKYQPRLTPEQMARPSNRLEQFEVALSTYDNDLVNVARVRFNSGTEMLDWLEKAQQQRDVNNINRTKPLTFPVR